MNHRLRGPINTRFSPTTANGRSYAAAPGQPLDVPDFDSAILQANGWTYVAPSGPSSSRPAGTVGMYQASQGTKFFDVTLGYLIEFDGAVWRNPATGLAV